MSSANLQQLPNVESVTRRRLLGGVIGTTAALTGVPTPSGGGTETPPVDALSSTQLLRRLPTIIADSEVRELHSDLSSAGWRAKLSDAVGHRSPPAEEGDPYEVVAVPYERPADGHDAVLLWTGTDGIETQSRWIEPVNDQRFEMRTATVDSGSVNAIRIDVDPAFWWYYCSINWSCLLSVAGAWAGSIAACGVCLAEPTRLSCLSCAGAVSGAIGGTLGCDVCQ